MKKRVLDGVCVSTRLPYVVLTLGALMLIPLGNAHAYIDAGSGSILFQVLIGLVLGAVMTLKLWWTKFKIFILGLLGKKPPADSSPAPDDAEK